MEKSKEKHSKLSWAVYIGSMFIGMGIGALYDHEDIGIFIGLGVGFIASALIESKDKGTSGEE